MPKEIKISDTTSRRLFTLANDFDDNEETIIKKLLDFYESHQVHRNERTIHENNEAIDRPGPRGNHKVENYLIPVIHLTKGEGLDKISAFKKLADTLDVNYSTVSAQCTRTLGLKSNNDFYNQVLDGRIYNYILNRYPNQPSRKHGKK